MVLLEKLMILNGILMETIGISVMFLLASKKATIVFWKVYGTSYLATHHVTITCGQSVEQKQMTVKHQYSVC